MFLSSFRFCFGLILLCPFLQLRAAEMDVLHDMKLVPKDRYELDYLGCDFTINPLTRSHTGHFLLVLKGDNAIELEEIGLMDHKALLLDGDFVIRNKGKWSYVGNSGLYDPAFLHRVTVQPGAVVKIDVNMCMAEHDTLISAGSVKGADRACLLLTSNEGQLVSEEIVLPPVIPR